MENEKNTEFMSCILDECFEFFCEKIRQPFIYFITIQLLELVLLLLLFIKLYIF
jgi:hypothetical protein